MLVTMLDYDNYLGRMAIGRIFHGGSRQRAIVLVKRDGRHERGKVTKILKYGGFARSRPIRRPRGYRHARRMENVKVVPRLPPRRTRASPHGKDRRADDLDDLFAQHQPALRKGRGTFLTSRHLRERLEHEAMINVGIHVEETSGGDRFKVSGRGELHLSILIETLRREGYELEVSRPEVILKTVDDEVLEPVEEW